MNQAGPTVSIAIPNHNYGRFLGRAIESALAQTYPIAEVLVVENGSTDESLAVAKEYAERDARVRVFKQMRLIGAAHNWNRCLEESRGEWICVLAADDMLHPEFVEATVARAQKDRNAVLVGVDYAVVDVDGNVISPAEGPWRYHGEAFRGTTMPGVEASNASLIRTDNSFGTPSMHLMKRELAIEVTGWDEEQFWLPDWEFTMRMFARGDYAHVARSLTLYRTHDKMSTVHVAQTSLEAIEGPVLFVRKLLAPNHPYGALDPAAVEHYRRAVAMKVVHVLQNAQQNGGSPGLIERLVGFARDPVFSGVISITGG